MYIQTVDDYQKKYGYCYTLNHYPPEIPKEAASVIKFTNHFIGESYDEEDEEFSSEATNVERVEVKFFKETKSGDTSQHSSVIDLHPSMFLPLPFGAINLYKSVVLIHPIRLEDDGMIKYKRLPHPESIKLIDPFKNERHFLNLKQLAGTIETFSILDSWGNNQYLPPSSALESVVSGERLASAFNHEYYFGISFGNSVYLYRDEFKIAKVVKNKILLPETLNHLYEQLSEFGFNVDIK